MSLRMVTQTDAAGVTLTLSGRLVGPWIAEVVRLVKEQEATGLPVTLDISDVAFVAREAVEILRVLIERGAVLRGCPAYLALQLEGGSAQ
jgi:hypothetical protein